nr:unnamed protein product [Callosobruchus analis]
MSIYCEAGVPPLYIKTKILTLNYAVNILSQPTHPNHCIIFDNDDLDTYFSRPTITRPTGARVTQTLRDIDIDLPSVFNRAFSRIPPWVVCPAIIRLDCSIYNKTESSAITLKQTFLGIVNSYNHATILYTDGSKSQEGVGAAFTTSSAIYQYRLNPNASIYMAELYAIWKALEFICSNETANTCLICSDSLSALKSLSDPFTINPLVQQVIEVHHRTTLIHKQVIFVWCPGHVNIPGNELADRAACEAIHCDTYDDKLLTDDFKTFIKMECQRLWERDYEHNINRIRGLSFRSSNWKCPIKLNRRDQVCLTRVRIGHTHLTTSYLLLGNNHPRCDECGASLTVNHLITECRLYNSQRQALGLPQALEACFSNADTIKRMIKFLKATKIYYKL